MGTARRRREAYSSIFCEPGKAMIIKKCQAMSLTTRDE
jgi:hypothetical protein